MDEDLPQRLSAESSSSSKETDAEDPYAWAKSMKNVQEEVGHYCRFSLHQAGSSANDMLQHGEAGLCHEVLKMVMPGSMWVLQSHDFHRPLFDCQSA